MIEASKILKVVSDRIDELEEINKLIIEIVEPYCDDSFGTEAGILANNVKRLLVKY